VFITLTLFFEV